MRMKTANPCPASRTNRGLIVKLCSLALVLFALAPQVRAQGPEGKNFGFGLILGEPLGGTVKFWTSYENAFVGDIGASYFGSPRIQGDYLWHFDAFHSHIVKMYAGPGVALGFGEGHSVFFDREGDKFITTDSRFGFGVRAVFGINVEPVRTPLELFLEAGPLIAMVPDFAAAFDVGVGIRFYP